MSFLTCFCDLPQKEHFSSSPPSPNLATSSFPRLGSAGPSDRAGVVGTDAARVTLAVEPFSPRPSPDLPQFPPGSLVALPGYLPVGGGGHQVGQSERSAGR